MIRNLVIVTLVCLNVITLVVMSNFQRQPSPDSVLRVPALQQTVLDKKTRDLIGDLEARDKLVAEQRLQIGELKKQINDLNDKSLGSSLPENSVSYEMLGDPAMSKIALAFVKGVQQNQNKVLFKHLKLPPEQMEAFRGLFAERTAQLFELEHKSKLQKIPVDPNMRAAINKQFREDVTSAFGEETGAFANDYISNIGVWSIIQNYEDFLSTANAPDLTDSQLGSLRRLIGEYRVKLPTTYDNETINEYLNKLSQNRSTLLNNVSGTLDQSQVDALSRHTANDIDALRYTLLIRQKTQGQKATPQMVR